MKAKFLLFVCAIVLSINVSAQYKEFQFGLMVQPGCGWFKDSNDNISNVKNKFTSKYGVFGSYYLTENYGFTSGIIIKNTGARYDFNYVTEAFMTQYRHDFKNTYLEIPVLFRGRTDQFSRFRVLGEFGVGFDFLVSNNESFSNIFGPDEHLKLKYRTFCPTLMIGLGTEINIYKSSSVLLELVFDKGLANMIRKTDETENYYDSAMKTTCLYLQIGFIF